MYLEDFKEIVERIESDESRINKITKALETAVGMNLVEFVEENLYTKIHIGQNYFLLDKLFEGNEELLEYMYWYLYYRTRYGKGNTLEGKNGISYEVTDIDSFMIFVKQEFNLKMKSK